MYGSRLSSWYLRDYVYDLNKAALTLLLCAQDFKVQTPREYKVITARRGHE
jgi:hypothetical protein